MFACKNCDKSYDTKSSLNRHTKKVHPNDVEKKKFHCGAEECQKTFNNKECLLRHRRSIHNIETIQTNRSYSNCPSCDYADINRESMLTHLEKVHRMEIRPELIVFSSEQEFLEWRHKTETSTHTKFIATGGKHKDRLIKSQSLYCHRGNKMFIPQGDHKRKPKLKGSRKLNFFCPAHIKYTEKDGIFEVKYVNVHTHELELEHLGLSYSDRCTIAKKIAKGESFPKILDDLTDSFYKGDQLERIHLTTRKDLHNIQQSFKLQEEKTHKNDTISIETWSREEDPESNSAPPALYCEEVPFSEYSDLLKDNFVVEGDRSVNVSEPVMLTKEDKGFDMKKEKIDLINMCTTMINEANEPDEVEFIKNRLHETFKTLKILRKSHKNKQKSGYQETY